MDQPRIDKITIEHPVDPHADPSYLGTYSDTPGPADRTIDRFPDGTDWTYRGQRRYFIAAMSADETGNPESVKQDYEREEAYNRGEWYLVGVKARAEVSYDTDGPKPGCRRIEWFTSPGLWGVESDSGADYLDEIGREELADLKGHLARFNVDVSNFDELAEKALAAPVRE